MLYVIVNTITLYFSLPFYPVSRKTHFYHGHISLALNDTIYQLYDPRLLKADFLISVMPKDEWLYGESRQWCHRNSGDRKYRFVYLYGLGEAYRTKLYYITFTGISSEEIRRCLEKIRHVESEYTSGVRSFNILSNNCSLFVRELIRENFGLKRFPLDFLPSIFFYRMAKLAKRRYPDSRIGSISDKKDDYRIHAHCIGIPFYRAESAMDSLIRCG